MSAYGRCPLVEVRLYWTTLAVHLLFCIFLFLGQHTNLSRQTVIIKSDLPQWTVLLKLCTLRTYMLGKMAAFGPRLPASMSIGNTSARTISKIQKKTCAKMFDMDEFFNSKLIFFVVMQACVIKGTVLWSSRKCCVTQS